MENRPRMRIECYSGRHSIDALCTIDDRLHYPLMPDMQSVKNTKSQDRWPCDIRILYSMKNLHQLSGVLLSLPLFRHLISCAEQDSFEHSPPLQHRVRKRRY